ncbi:type II toxin-antitoxin system PemK/MazF family toxin [Streptomyces sp. N2-109]|uniref:Type II toxin-antitoxin system PemK/MazF family toxin n=1 Tax=Streptomyces gossypii TaxID=2883101 RepID=A0ABT2JTM0_9ACTN|nr:type II toxin-antitoxin system PemK/MazF family toxin [Streptomyces gossypii]MCT2591239.1 type II toxin-antitoxin system PemK/MazF family toxin [Streptomyces gossypii]
METWSWLALGAVAVLALAATLVDGTGRLGRSRGSVRAGGVRTGAPLPRPLPGEIWWAAPPPSDTAGPGEWSRGAVWLCLVLAVSGDSDSDSVRVAPITDAAEAHGPPSDPATAPLRLPPGPLGEGPYRLEATSRHVPRSTLRRRIAELPPDQWAHLRHLGG